MKRFEISLTPEAQRDASMLRYAIIFKYRAPLTAKRYLEGLNKKIRSLEVGADSIQVDTEQTERYGLKFGASTIKRWQSYTLLKARQF